MPTGGGAQPSGVFKTVLVHFVALGGELDVIVPIGVTMADAAYGITWASAGGLAGDGKQTSGIEVADLPTADRTTVQFRAVFGQALTAGDRVDFVITGSVA